MGSLVWAKFPKIDPPAARLLCETAIFFGKFLDFYSGRNSVKFLRKNTYVLPNAKLRRWPRYDLAAMSRFGRFRAWNVL